VIEANVSQIRGGGGEGRIRTFDTASRVPPQAAP
jgi:hypothetical protein